MPKFISIITLLLLSFGAVAQEEVTPEAAGTEPVALAEYIPWDNETLNLFATLPVQDQGRVKPLDTLAQFTALKINGKRSNIDGVGRGMNKSIHLQWYLDCLFYPERAVDYACFMINDYAVLTAIGIEEHEEKKSRYSYNELRPGREKLQELAQQYYHKEATERDPIESQILNLYENMGQFDQLIHYFDFSWKRFNIASGTTRFAKAFSDEAGVPLSEVIVRSQSVMDVLIASKGEIGEQEANAEINDFFQIVQQAGAAVQFSRGTDFLPPLDPAVEEWFSPSEIFTVAVDFPQASEERVDLLALLETLPQLRDDRVAFKTTLKEFHTGAVAAATERGEYSKVPMEVHFYKAQYLFYSQVLFVFSFMLITLTWLFPGSKWLNRATVVSILVPTVLLIIGITLRCIIRSRPPVSTLYETVLFITATAIVCALFIELFNRQRIAQALASFLGMAGMLLAFRYEAKEGVDTMPSLVAVLDTNFWLATHVTTVTAGYAAGLLSGAISHVYIIGRFFGYKKNDRNFYRSLTRMSYGVLCFGLLFATVGTILGGVWANDSWGRFWGWDPKENGALLICLWMIITMHAKMGRIIRELGINQCAVVCAMIVTFSWWGVNNLGVGMHAYGFTDGLWQTLFTYWGIELVVLFMGGVVWIKDAMPGRGSTPKASA